MADFDELVMQLADIDAQLSDLPDDAYDERVTLRMKQTELRGRIHTIVPDYDHSRSTRELYEELEGLEAILQHLYDSEINVAGQGTASGTGSKTDAATDAIIIDGQIEEGRNVHELEERIAHLRRVLDER